MDSFVENMKEELTGYGKSMTEVGKLRLIGIISRLLGRFLLLLTVVLCVLALLAFVAVAVIDALSQVLPVWAAALIIGSIYLVLIVVAILCRKQLFVNPFIKLLSKDIKSEEELAIETLEAEHEADLHMVEMKNNVRNFSRDMSVFARLIGRGWTLLKGLTKK